MNEGAARVSSDDPSTGWKALLALPVEPSGASVSRRSRRIGSDTSEHAEGTPPTRMGLQFELREQLPRTNERWRGPTAQAVKTIKPAHGDFRLGVRPVV